MVVAGIGKTGRWPDLLRYRVGAVGARILVTGGMKAVVVTGVEVVIGELERD